MFKMYIYHDFKTLTIMYWLPNKNFAFFGNYKKFSSFECKSYLHQKVKKNPIVASRKCSTKAFSKAVTKAFKLIFKQIQSFQGKSHFYSDYKKVLGIWKL